MKKSKHSRLLLAVLGLFSTVALLVFTFICFGLPLNLYTWIVVVLCAVSGASLAFSGKWQFLFTVPLLTCVYLAVPIPFQFFSCIEICSLFDDVGGRSGWVITPGLKFGKDGPNTLLLESYLGPLKPNWWYQASHSPYIRDGNERVQSRNVIRYEYFPEILAMLPDDDARRTVIEALTDTENRLRVHQGLLLVCLHVLKYPEGMNAGSWWMQHQQLFISEHDPSIAASMTQGWLQEIDRLFANDVPNTIGSQYRAARYQQRGSWGGHRDFGKVFLEMEFGERKPDAHSAELGRKVIWWPEHQAKNAN